MFAYSLDFAERCCGVWHVLQEGDGKDGVEGYLSQPRDTEDDFGEIGSTENNAAQVKHYYGDEGQQSISEDVLADDGSLRQPLGSCSGDECLSQIIEHG